nr:SusC/RagA family TonB-linked outer membrane protein [Saprospiraceae bacterium]
TIPVFNENNIGGFAGIDPVFHGVARGINWYGRAILEENKFTTDRIVGNVAPQLTLLPGLTYKLNLSLDYSIQHNYAFQPVFFLSTSQEASNDIARLNESYTRFVGTLIENTLNYSKSFGGHNLDLLAGYTSQKGSARSVIGIGTNFSTNDQRVLSAAIDNTDVNGQLQQNALLSVLGRINYNFKGKYLLSATIRRDGSSRFAEENRWGTFPSISAGWRISDEAFFPKGFITNLKVRGSYGELGSQNIGNFDIVSGINIDNGYNYAGVNSGTSAGSIVRQIANRNLIWETTKTTNIGIDAGFLDDKITLTLEYFQKRSQDILTNLPIPLHGGLGNSLRSNAATIDNQGFELAATYRGGSSVKDFSYSIGFNLSTLNNEVVALGEGVNPISGGQFSQSGVLATRTDVGHPVASFYGFVVEGLYQNEAEIQADGRTDAVVGDFNYLDLDNDGDIDDDDRTFLGDAIPDLSFGLNFTANYKDFDFGLFIQGVSGIDIWNGKRLQFILDGSGGNKITEVIDAWTPQNTDTDIPRLTVRDQANNRRSSSFYVEDGSYLRLKSLQVGYTIPTKLADILSISSARIYISGQNIFTITDYTGYDPEIGRGGIFENTSIFNGGVDRNTYPQAKTWFAGIQVNF